MVDYYKVLNVCRTASDEEIKKAYKKLALRWHPDKNQDNLEEANHRFRELSEAYDVLSDHNKRRVYDMFGKEGLVRDLEEQSSSSRDMYRFDDFGDMGSDFVFRQPEEIFFEFFGVSLPFGASFSEPANLPDMEFLIPLMPFPSFSTFGINDGSVAGTSGAVTRTATTTTFVNGKKLTTKRFFENDMETILTYENDVLKTKTVNGVAQKVPAIKTKRTSRKHHKKP